MRRRIKEEGFKSRGERGSVRQLSEIKRQRVPNSWGSKRKTSQTITI